MRLERENGAPIVAPAQADLALAVRNMRSTGPSSMAVLLADDGGYLQFAGGPQLFLLERRSPDRRHFRACQAEPVAPYEDGTQLHCSAGRIPLRRDEWFKSAQLIEVLEAFANGEPWPEFLTWREIVVG